MTFVTTFFQKILSNAYDKILLWFSDSTTAAATTENGICVWSAFSNCSAKCVGQMGIRVRHRFCTTGNPIRQEVKCEGSNTRIKIGTKSVCY